MPGKKGEANGLGMDQCHDADTSVSASPTGALEQRCPGVPVQAQLANSPSSVTSSVLKALNIIYMASPLPSISPLKSSHLNPRLVNTTQLPLS